MQRRTGGAAALGELRVQRRVASHVVAAAKQDSNFIINNSNKRLPIVMHPNHSHSHRSHNNAVVHSSTNDWHQKKPTLQPPLPPHRITATTMTSGRGATAVERGRRDEVTRTRHAAMVGKVTTAKDKANKNGVHIITNNKHQTTNNKQQHETAKAVAEKSAPPSSSSLHPLPLFDGSNTNGNNACKSLEAVLAESLLSPYNNNTNNNPIVCNPANGTRSENEPHRHHRQHEHPIGPRFSVRSCGGGLIGGGKQREPQTRRQQQEEKVAADKNGVRRETNSVKTSKNKPTNRGSAFTAEHYLSGNQVEKAVAKGDAEEDEEGVCCVFSPPRWFGGGGNTSSFAQHQHQQHIAHEQEQKEAPTSVPMLLQHQWLQHDRDESNVERENEGTHHKHNGKKALKRAPPTMMGRNNYGDQKKKKIEEERIKATIKTTAPPTALQGPRAVAGVGLQQRQQQQRNPAVNASATAAVKGRVAQGSGGVVAAAASAPRPCDSALMKYKSFHHKPIPQLMSGHMAARTLTGARVIRKAAACSSTSDPSAALESRDDDGSGSGEEKAVGVKRSSSGLGSGVRISEAVGITPMRFDHQMNMIHNRVGCDVAVPQTIQNTEVTPFNNNLPQQQFTTAAAPLYLPPPPPPPFPFCVDENTMMPPLPAMMTAAMMPNSMRPSSHASFFFPCSSPPPNHQQPPPMLAKGVGGATTACSFSASPFSFRSPPEMMMRSNEGGAAVVGGGERSVAANERKREREDAGGEGRGRGINDGHSVFGLGEQFVDGFSNDRLGEGRIVQRPSGATIAPPHPSPASIPPPCPLSSSSSTINTLIGQQPLHPEILFGDSLSASPSFSSFFLSAGPSPPRHPQHQHTISYPRQHHPQPPPPSYHVASSAFSLPMNTSYFHNNTNNTNDFLQQFAGGGGGGDAFQKGALMMKDNQRPSGGAYEHVQQQQQQQQQEFGQQERRGQEMGLFPQPFLFSGQQPRQHGNFSLNASNSIPHHYEYAPHALLPPPSTAPPQPSAEAFLTSDSFLLCCFSPIKR